MVFIRGIRMTIQPVNLGGSALKELWSAVTMTSTVCTSLGIEMRDRYHTACFVFCLSKELLGGPQAWPLLLASCPVPGVLQLLHCLIIDYGNTEACLAGDFGAMELCENDSGRPLLCPVPSAGETFSSLESGSQCLTGTPPLTQTQVYACASSVFQGAGMLAKKVQYAAIGTGNCKLCTAFVTSVVIGKVGLWVLLLLMGYSLMTCWGTIFTLALCLQSSFPRMPYLAVSCIFVFILSFGLMGVVLTSSGVSSNPKKGLFLFLYIPFLCACGAIYTHLFLPEIKDKTILAITEEMCRLTLA
ncbi:solute carrier family 2, facilitated glucose transporter member 11 [Peromyscus eremicus]|uniref:solute carrier family 2, facilitated glucose transporter member 11 n=1 Tax=Peromyscus eremicus TaxID=42410 RepID=UPI0027DE7E2A|nr:solute carrier family 2, facilitated glucose transporter member 11 [Peromyscus eremicus]